MRKEGGGLRDDGGGILDPELTYSKTVWIKDRVTKKLEPNLTKDVLLVCRFWRILCTE